MPKFKRCRDFCDYEAHYLNQAKNLDDSIIPYQRGANWFTNFAKRYGIPALKYLGKQAVKFGRDVFWDVARGKDLKTSAKTQLKKGVSGALDDLSKKISSIETKQTKPPAPSLRDHLKELQSETKQSGTGKRKKGQKRKGKPKKQKVKKRKKFDIFE